MKKTVVFFISLMYLLAACKKEKQASGTMPACINTSIADLRNDSIQVDSVKEYNFNGRIIYVLKVSQCCDLPSPVVDQNCNTICYLGGFTPSQDCEGRQFDSAAVFIETVWRR